MSAADEQLIRDFYEDWNRRGIESLPDHLPEGVVWHDDPAGPDVDPSRPGGLVHRGLDAARGRLQNYVDVMGAFRVVDPGVSDLGEGRYLAEFTLAVRGEASGLAFEAPHGHLIEVRDGQIAEMHQVLDPPTKRRELGLDP